MTNHNYIGLPPDGIGKKLHTVETLINSTTYQNQVISIGDPRVPTNLQYIDNQGQAFIRFAEGAPLFDAFGKLKVSQEIHLNSYTSLYDTLANKGLVIQDNASITYDSEKSKYIFLNQTNHGAISSFKTHKRFFYTVGSGIYVLQTLSFGDSGKDGVIRRFGLFDDSNGVYFEVDNNGLNVCIKNNGNVTKVNRQNFNVDKLNGDGLSGFTIDITKLNIYWIDFQWLGAGRVRFGVIHPNGSRITAHIFENANSSPNMYMSNPVLPYTVQQINVEESSAVSQMNFFNFAIMVDGDFRLPFVKLKSAVLPNTISITNTPSVIWSLKLKDLVFNKRNNGIVMPYKLDIYSECPAVFLLVKNAELTDATWDYQIPDSICVGDTTATSYAGGEVLYSTVVHDVLNIDISDSFDYITGNNFLKLRADNTSDKLTCIMYKIGDDTPCKAYPLMTWKESLP